MVAGGRTGLAASHDCDRASQPLLARLPWPLAVAAAASGLTQRQRDPTRTVEPGSGHRRPLHLSNWLINWLGKLKGTVHLICRVV